MKKRNLLLVVLLGLTMNVFAQDLVTFGVRGGFNYSTVSGEYTFDDYGYQYYEYPTANIERSKLFKPGFNVGIDALRKLNDKMALQVELFYANEGYKGDWTYDYEARSTGTFTDQYSFLNLPVFFKYNFTKHFYVMGGPQFSLLLSAKHKGESVMDGYPSVSNTRDLADRMNKLSIGVTPSVGYDLNKMSFSLRYYAGLTSLVKSEHDMDIKSQVLSVVVSYKVFTIKK